MSLVWAGLLQVNSLCRRVSTTYCPDISLLVIPSTKIADPGISSEFGFLKGRSWGVFLSPVWAVLLQVISGRDPDSFSSGSDSEFGFLISRYSTPI